MQLESALKKGLAADMRVQATTGMPSVDPAEATCAVGDGDPTQRYRQMLELLSRRMKSLASLLRTCYTQAIRYRFSYRFL